MTHMTNDFKRGPDLLGLVPVLLLALLGIGAMTFAFWSWQFIFQPPQSLVDQIAERMDEIVNLSVTASGDVQVPLPVDSANMPNCDELGVPGCKWKSDLFQDVNTNERLVDTKLTRDGGQAGRVQTLEISTAEYEELHVLHKMGYEKVWISRIEVAESLQGNGLGRSLWQASDVMIKTITGPGKAVHVLVDTVGWGAALMQDIAKSDILIAAKDWWAYIIQ